MDRSIGRRCWDGDIPGFCSPFSFSYSLFLGVLPNTEFGRKSFDRSINTIKIRVGLAEEGLREAEQLPAIGCGKAAKQFAKELSPERFNLRYRVPDRRELA